MQSGFILIVLFTAGGFAAEFNDRLACQEAQAQIAAMWGKGTSYVHSFCVPAGANGGRK